MNYQEVMQRALKGRSVNAAAKDMGLPQQSLNRWVLGKNLPDYASAAILAAEARLSLGEMMRVLVDEDQRRKLALIYGRHRSTAPQRAPRASWPTAQSRKSRHT